MWVIRIGKQLLFECTQDRLFHDEHCLNYQLEAVSDFTVGTKYNRYSDIANTKSN
jgi:hypothetical protein